MSDESADTPSPMAQHNSQMLALLENRVISGMQAALQPCDYYVIQHRESGVIATTASTTASSKAQYVVFGPSTFTACNAYINSRVVTQLAYTSPKFHTHHPSRSPTTPSQSEGAST